MLPIWDSTVPVSPALAAEKLTRDDILVHTLGMPLQNELPLSDSAVSDESDPIEAGNVPVMRECAISRSLSMFTGTTATNKLE